MSRRALVGLLASLMVLAGALAIGLNAGGSDAGGSDAGADGKPAAAALASLRARAALEPCPTGLGLDLELTLPCLGGGPAVNLASPPSGTPTLVNVYGSWCGPCQDEMPLLQAFHDRAGAKVALVGVDSQDAADQALAFAIDFKQRWPAVVDDDGVVFRKYGGPPATLFVDGTGKVRHVKRGPFRSAAEIDGLVRKHLGVTL